jgi:hypothetical protein
VISFDEISLHRGHGQYVLIIFAPEVGLVLDVLPNRDKETLKTARQENLLAPGITPRSARG